MDFCKKLANVPDKSFFMKKVKSGIIGEKWFNYVEKRSLQKPVDHFDSLSLSLSNTRAHKQTHTRTQTHIASLSLSNSFSLFLSISLSHSPILQIPQEPCAPFLFCICLLIDFLALKPFLLTSKGSLCFTCKMTFWKRKNNMKVFKPRFSILRVFRTSTEQKIFGRLETDLKWL